MKKNKKSRFIGADPGHIHGFGRKRNNDTILDCVRKFKPIFEDSDDMMFMCESDGKGHPGNIIYANKAARRILGYSKHELVNSELGSLWKKPVNLHAKIPHGTDRRGMEAFFLTKAGKALPVTIKNRSVAFNGNAGIISVVTDLSREKKLETHMRVQAVTDKLRTEILTLAANGIGDEFLFLKDCLTKTGKGLGLNRMLYFEPRGEFIVCKSEWKAPDAGGAFLNFRIPKKAVELVPAHLMRGGIISIGMIVGIMSRRSRDPIAKTVAGLACKFGVRPGIFATLKIGGIIKGYIIAVSDSDEFWTREKRKCVHDILRITARALEKHILEIKLLESEMKFRKFFKFSSMPLFLYDTKGTFLDGNYAAEKAIGYKKEELIGRNFFRAGLLPEGEVPRIAAVLIRNRAGLSISPMEVRLRKKSGEIRTFEMSATTIKTPGNDVVLGAAFDISRRKATEDAIKESEEKYRQLFDNINEPVFLNRIDGKGGFSNFIDMNEAACRVFGYSKKQFMGMSMADLEEKAGQESPLRQGVALMKKSNRMGFESVNIDSKGRKFPVEVGLSAFNYRGGRFVIASVKDLSARKEMEHALSLSEKYFRALTEQSSDIIFVLSPEGRINYVSPSIENILKIKPESVTGKFLPAIDARMSRGAIEAVLRKLLEEPGYAFYREMTFLNRSFEVIVRNLMNDPAISGIVANFRDITVRKKAEDSLKKAIERLERSNEDLEQFAYTASHDLKEPLRVISNYLELLKMRFGDKFGKEAGEYIDYAVSGAGRMYELIQGLLSYSRIGRKQGDIMLLNLNVLIGNVIHEFGENALPADIKIGKLPRISGNPVEMSILFRNLIGNSLKFSRKNVKPLIEIACKDAGLFWEFMVTDNGIGIEPQYHVKIFGLFERLHNESEYPGTGLGLTLCRKIILNLGGGIWIDPGYTRGTRVCFKIPKKESID